MSLQRKIYLVIACALALSLIELLLGSLGVSLLWRGLVILAGIAVTAFIAVRQLRQFNSDISAIREAVDQTARGEFESEIAVSGADEIAAIAESIRVMRGRIAEMGRHMVESLRIESLNLLGSILVHDMKNLSFRLHCLSQNLTANYADPDFRESLVRTLDYTTDQMDQMVHRFRQQKEMIVVKLRANLNEIVHSALGNLRRDGERISISEYYGEIPLVWADALLLENAIFNIVENAREAMPQGGILAVRTSTTDAAENGHGYVLIEIGDSGPGMSEEFIRKDLFAPFVTTKPRGLGLGLYTCLQVIRMHDGKITVQSEPGRGTVFCIYLPIID